MVVVCLSHIYLQRFPTLFLVGGERERFSRMSLSYYHSDDVHFINDQCFNARAMRAKLQVC